MEIVKTIAITAIFSIIWMVAASASGVKYEYDDLGRLVKVIYDNDTPTNTGDDKTVDYAYDAAGNRTLHTVAGTGLTTDPNAGGGVVVLPISGFIIIPLPGSVVGN